MSRLLLFIILMLGHPMYHSGQIQSFYENGLRITHYRELETLAPGFMNTVKKDNAGHLWITIADAIVKYNGIEFQKKTILDKNGRGVGRLFDIVQAPSGDYWISGDGNFISYDPLEQSYTRYPVEPGNTKLALHHIIKDKNGYLWCGSFNGLLGIDPESELAMKHLVVPSIAAGLESLIRSNELTPIETLTGVPNNQLIQKEFVIEEDRYVLILGQGELDYTKTYYLPVTSRYVDYGWLVDDLGNVVWEMDPADSYCAGGLIKNRINAQVIKLSKGSYTIHYKTNHWYAYENWTYGSEDYEPSRPEWWGIQVLPCESNFESELQQMKLEFKARGGLGSDFSFLYQDLEGNIWIYGQSLQKLSFDTSDDPRFEDVINWGQKSGDSRWLGVLSIEQKDSSHLWISGVKLAGADQEHSILGYINTRTDEFVEIETGLPATYTFDVMKQAAGNLWLGSSEYKFRGAYQLSPPFIKKGESGRVSVRFFNLSEDTLNGHPGNAIVDMECDDFNNLWITTERNYLFKIDLDPPMYTYDKMEQHDALKDKIKGRGLLDDHGNLWTAVRKDDRKWTVAKYNLQTKHLTYFTDDIGSIPCDHLKLAGKLPNGNILVHNENFLIEYDTKSDRSIAHPIEGIRFGFAHESASWYRLLNDSLIIIPGLMSTYIVDINKWSLFTFKSADGSPIHLFPFKSATDGYWVQTPGGMMRFRINGDRIDTILPPRKVEERYVWNTEDPEGNFWQYNYRLYKRNLETGVQHVYSQEHGLREEQAGRVSIDESGRIWIFHHVGVSIFDPKSEQAFTPSGLAGLQGSGFGTPIPAPNNGVYKFGQDGLYFIDRSRVVRDSIAPILSIEKFTTSKGDLASMSIFSVQSFTDSPEINYVSNDISIEYMGIHLDDPENVQYQYRLIGHQDSWQQVGKERIARFLNLPHGSYTFQVKAANADGIWSESEGMSFTILPPWWLTWWMKLLYGILTLGLLAYWIGSLRKKVKEKEEQLKKEQAFSTELKELNEANQRFVPVDFLEILGKESIKDLHLGEQTRTNMTILFSDIRSYTTLSESMSADDNFKFINGYLGRVGPVIKKHGGFISSYMGDGLMALFLDDHQGAVRAAIAMQKVLEEYNEERKGKGREPINTGIGLNTGDLMLGIIGDQDRYDSTVISDAVNTASRMEGLTKIFGAAIIISEKTLQELQNEEGNVPFAYRPLGKVRVKGKEQAVAIYDLYEGEIVMMRQLKAQTQKEFEKGIHHYFHRQFGKAAEAFKVVLENNPDDLAAQYYLDKCVDYIVNDVPEAWNGVEEMIMK